MRVLLERPSTALRVDYELTPELHQFFPELPKRTPAHPAFADAIEAAMIHGPKNQLRAVELSGTPAGVDQKALGLPPQAWPRAGERWTMRAGITLAVQSAQGLGFKVPLRYTTDIRPGLIRLYYDNGRTFTYEWRCLEHDDCKESPGLGYVCTCDRIARRGRR